MTILVIGSGVPDGDHRTGLFAYDQAKSLVKAGHTVVFFGIDLRSIRRWRKFGIIFSEKDGIKRYVISIPIGAVHMGFQLFIGKWALKKLFLTAFKDKSRPCIIHAHFFTFGYIASSLAKSYRVPLIITEHSSLVNTSLIKRNVYKYALAGYSSADIVIAVSSSLAEMIKSHFDIMCKIVPNIVDVDIFTSSTRLPHKGFNLVTTSNLIRLKRIDLLISAFELFQQEYPESQLYIVGDGPERLYLENCSKMTCASDKINFLGRLSRPEIAELYKKCDCFVLVSASETFGVAYIEAMASGLPVIATRCGGPEDFVNDQNGILVPVNDVGAIVGAMKKTFKTGSAFDRQRIRHFVIQHFSPYAVAAQLTEIYEMFLKQV